MNPPLPDADSIAAASKSMQLQQAQLMAQMNQIMNDSTLTCGPGTACYNDQQITNARNAYNAAVITEQNAPKNVDSTFKTYLVASQGQTKANETLLNRYIANGKIEKANYTDQIVGWIKNMTNKINTNTGYAETIKSLGNSNNAIKNVLEQGNRANTNATNTMNVLERKIHYTNQQVAVVNNVEHYVKLVYWLAFITWGFCVIYTRAFTLKTAGMFVLFTVIILMQHWIMDGIIYCLKFIIPNNTYLTW
jgi:hypothetical protein